MRKFGLIFLIFLTGIQISYAASAMLTESFSLRYRPAEDLIPLVKPFLHQEGAISGSGYKLFVKTTGSNMEQLKEIISELDVQLKTLRISITSDSRAFDEQKQAQVNISSGSTPGTGSPGVQKIVIEKGAKHKVTTRVFSTETRSTQPVSQYVQLLEGQWASINTGSAVPYTERTRNPDGTVTETIHYQKYNTGFKIRAHTNGDTVYLTLRPEIEHASQQGGGKTVYQNIDTTITTQMNKWVEIGGTSEAATNSGSGILYQTQRQHEQVRGMFVKVELVN